MDRGAVYAQALADVHDAALIGFYCCLLKASTLPLCPTNQAAAFWLEGLNLRPPMSEASWRTCKTLCNSIF